MIIDVETEDAMLIAGALLNLGQEQKSVRALTLSAQLYKSLGMEGMAEDIRASAQGISKATYDTTRWPVNFWSTGEVVTNDGEVIGTWERDDEDHPSFIPSGASEALFWNIGIPLLARDIEAWLDAHQETDVGPKGELLKS